MQSNWRQAIAAFRAGFLTRLPTTLVWHGDKYWVDDVPVSEAVYDLASGKRLEQAREQWLRETHDAWSAVA